MRGEDKGIDRSLNRPNVSCRYDRDRHPVRNCYDYENWMSAIWVNETPSCNHWFWEIGRIHPLSFAPKKQVQII